MYNLFFSFISLGIICFVELGHRKIPITFKSISKTRYQKYAYLPIKINFAGIIPPIFSSTLIAFIIPMISFSPYLKYYLHRGSFLYQALFSILVVFFSYFYTKKQFNVNMIITNMLKSNIFIPGIRAGNKTRSYINNTLNKIIFLGSLYLIFLCLLPIILQKLLLKNITFFFGGTTLLLISTIIIELIRQINNILIMKSYTEFKYFWEHFIAER
jgi:preprotein translocase subunit SecY